MTTLRDIAGVSTVIVAAAVLAGCVASSASASCVPAAMDTTSSVAGDGPLPKNARAGDAWRSTMDGMILKYVPAGEFLMGASETDAAANDDERPQHMVALDGFWIDSTEVSNGMYASCVKEGACTPPVEDSSLSRRTYASAPSCSGYPVVEVSWQQAADYCHWAGRRLPTEAEWEKAARGTDARVFPWGNDYPSDAVANLCGRECLRIEPRDPGIDDGYLDTAPVGSFEIDRSVFGVLDMAGNVAEWVADRGQADYYSVSPSVNPAGPIAGETRVFRGGAFVTIGSAARLSARGYLLPTTTSNFIGFRCALSAAP
jgi:formylglycine-generating enzyme required for sulfatase activity